MHFLVSRSPDVSEERLANIIAEGSKKFINEEKLAKKYFSWQYSASAFSVSKSNVAKVCKYILNQPEYHKKITFQEEYEKFIKHYQETLIR